ncbi:alkylhydroperoxidase [Streptomyces venezuelae]|uniref:Alkylhydroperoxidase n=1 Tax=Streptomyces venezuelae TaxID=54571 RepID=A0A5P2C1C1_STRVZ|nr:carboxymuconolactone decarboxylase family protein [Streptomyces venezuelae]QES35728.1 alkylhydroperoxidase [Streptomyces venezuelae]
MFTARTLETAPPDSRPAMERTAAAFGQVPDAVARLAESPELLNGFLEMTAVFDRTTLDPVAREVVVMTVATRNDCHICVTLHTGKLRKLGAGSELVNALREQRPLGDERLEAVRRFTLAVLATAGGVPDDDLQAFLAHGHTERNALEVVLGIGAYTMSTLANRLTRAA